MPVIASPDRPFYGPRAVPPTPEAEREPGVLDTFAAAFRQNNVVASFVAAQQAREVEEQPVEGFDPFDAIAGTPDADFAERFDGATSPAQVERIRRQLRQEQRDRETIEDSGGLGFAAALAAGASDPLFLATLAIPGGQVRGAGRAAAMFRAAGLGAASEIPIEATLQATQQLRTAQEGAINIGGAAVLSGLLGGALYKGIPRSDLQPVEEAIERELRMPDSTVGAAAASRASLDDLTLAAGGETVAKTLGKPNPNLRLATSPSQKAREIGQELVESPYTTRGNLKGIASAQAIETDLKRAMGDWWRAYRERRALYADYRVRANEAGEEVLSRGEFNRRVAYAMRRNDESAIPEVAQAAKVTRRIVFEPWKQRATKLGLLPDDVAVTGAESYLTRQYNIPKIRAEYAQWIELLRSSFRVQGADEAEALDIAHQTTRNILGGERGTLDLDIVPKSGRTKERTLKLPDSLLEPYLVDDIDTLSQSYLRTLAPEVTVTERFGDRDLKVALGEVRDEYAVLKSQTKDNAKLKKLEDREAADIRDLEAIRDRLYGTYGNPKDPGSFFVRAGRFIRAWNYVRLLGGQTLTSLTDAGRLFMIYGAPKLLTSSIRLGTSVKALNLTKTDARRMGIGLDYVLNSRALQLGDVDQVSQFAEQRVMRSASNAFSIISLQSPWNTVMKSWASVMSQDDFLRAAVKVREGTRLGKNLQARLASLGLDDAMLRRIAIEADVHGIEDNGLRFANSDQWTDQAAARAFENSVIREADTAVLTPGAGELPLVYSSEWGKALLQFKSYALSSTSRLVVPMLQGWAQGDLKMMSGTMALFGLSSMSYTLKQLAADQVIESDPVRFAREMVDKSGVLAWGGDILFPGLWQFGADDLSRWSDRQPVETLLGPVAGTVADAYTSRWPVRVMDGEVTEADVHKLRRLMPGQNLFYIRRLVNELEAQAAE